MHWARSEMGHPLKDFTKNKGDQRPLLAASSYCQDVAAGGRTVTSY